MPALLRSALVLALVLATVLTPVDAKKKKSKNPADDMVDMPMDADVGKAEADALGQALNSGKMDGEVHRIKGI